MQYYTKQQVQGSVRYSPRSLIGNWNEDRNVEETVIQDFLAKSDAGSLKIDRFQAKMAQALAPVELTTVRDDGFVHFGDVLQFAHAGTNAVLAADVNDVDQRTGEHACASTAAPQMVAPCARNTFLIAKYVSSRLDVTTVHYEDDVLRYGQKVRIIANPQIRGEPLDADGGAAPLCLFSKALSETHHSKYSHHQISGFTTRTDYDTVFVVMTPDPAKRIASQGVEVMAGVPICLQHCGTSSMLCLEDAAYPNDYGIERELSFHTTRTKAKQLTLVHEKQGELTRTLSSAPMDANAFRILTGTKVATLPASGSVGFKVNEILSAVNAALLHSSLGFEGFKKKLLRMDVSGSGKLRADEVLLALAYAGVEVAPSDLELLAKHFGGHQPGHLNARELLAQLEMMDTKAQGAAEA